MWLPDGSNLEERMGVFARDVIKILIPAKFSQLRDDTVSSFNNQDIVRVTQILSISIGMSVPGESVDFSLT